jgi:hypothetical protein
MSKKIKNKKEIKMPELSATIPTKKKRGRPKKNNVLFNPLDMPKKKMGRPRNLPEPPKHAFTPVDAFNPLDPDYDELYVNNIPKKKIGRPRKNPVVPVLKKKMGRPRKNPVVPVLDKPKPAPAPAPLPKCENCGIEFHPKCKRSRCCSKKCINEEFYKKNYKRKTAPINQELNTATEKPLDNFTKRTVIVGESNQKETLALEFSNQRVKALKHDNKKLLELNNEKIIEVSKLKRENANLKLELDEIIAISLSKPNEVVRKPSHLTNIIFMIIYLVVGIGIGIAFMFSLAIN